MKYLSLCIAIFFLTDGVWGRSLKSSFDKLNVEATRIGYAIGLFALVLVSIYLMIGKNDAGQKATQVLIGISVLVTSKAIFNFIQGLA